MVSVQGIIKKDLKTRNAYIFSYPKYKLKKLYVRPASAIYLILNDCQFWKPS